MSAWVQDMFCNLAENPKIANNSTTTEAIVKIVKIPRILEIFDVCLILFKTIKIDGIKLATNFEWQPNYNRLGDSSQLWFIYTMEKLTLSWGV